MSTSAKLYLVFFHDFFGIKKNKFTMESKRRELVCINKQ